MKIYSSKNKEIIKITRLVNVHMATFLVSKNCGIQPDKRWKNTVTYILAKWDHLGSCCEILCGWLG